MSNEIIKHEAATRHNDDDDLEAHIDENDRETHTQPPSMLMNDGPGTQYIHTKWKTPSNIK